MLHGNRDGGFWERRGVDKQLSERRAIERSLRDECRQSNAHRSLHFIHAIALFVLALFGTTNRGAWWLLFAGIFLFSGSLYVMALSNLRWLGAITPFGGLCFLAGWLWLMIAPPR